ncbi:hypothetical protein M427DRAFT_56583 [Gonapodya prolifera JEL478]|uniref:Mitochondrial adapter protein MCP1 transmembrane domain-containing protein n=1 Tax=Gonapodya prolifera (strain JEL478) TaxID=1344416 RepID=A0A139AG76_GONPJ|nr:hypothetical protein M427DRAFT_56583 [Gonapodya prolifera JEL478]|eukprot:KXS15758.1 hypothetical protein M427DRAFT_56583 [Gonapodya prolifera JEL478]
MSAPPAPDSPTPSPVNVDALLARIQAASGLAFASFSVIHLSSWILLHSGSFDTADAALRVFRLYYQHPLVEPVVVGGSLLVHVGSSLARIARRQTSAASRKSVTFEPAEEDIAQEPTATTSLSPVTLDKSYHRYAGWILALQVPIHVTATRINPLKILGAQASAKVIGAHFASFPTVVYPVGFRVYYALLATSGLYHTVAGIGYALKTLRLLPPSTTDAAAAAVIAPSDETSLRIRRWVLLGLGLSTVAALSGVYYEVRFSEEQVRVFGVLNGAKTA